MSSILDFEQNLDLLKNTKHQLLTLLNLGAKVSFQSNNQEGKYFTSSFNVECPPSDIDPQLLPLFSFRVLILDDKTNPLIAPIIRLADLRNSQITMHLSIRQQRLQIPDTAIIYLIHPTKQNFNKIAEDLQRLKYDYVFIYLASPITEQENIRNLSIRLSQSRVLQRVIKVVECPLNYFPITHNLFTLNNASSIISPQQTFNNYHKLASGICSLLKSNDLVPSVFQVHSQQRPKAVFQKLSDILKQEQKQMAPSSSSFDSGFAGAQGQVGSKNNWNKRLCMVILIDRDIDNHSGLYHSWRYIPLIQDIIAPIKNGKIKTHIQEQKEDENFKIQNDNDQEDTLQLQKTEKSAKQFDIDFLNDRILRQNMLNRFHVVADTVSKLFNQWKGESDMVSRFSAENKVQDLSGNLSKALDDLPHLSEQKKRLDTHMSLIFQANSQIQSRRIPQFIQLEKRISRSETLMQTDFKDLIKLLSQHNSTNYKLQQNIRIDKLRLVLIFIIASQNLDPNKLGQVLNAFRSGCGRKPSDITAISNAIKISVKDEQLQKMTEKLEFFRSEQQQQEKQQGQSKPNKSFAKSMLSGLTGSLKDQVFSMKNAFAKSRNNILAQSVKSIIDGNNPNGQFNIAEYKNRQISQIPEAKKKQLYDLQTRVNNIVVFVIGGGSFYEYQTLLELQKSTEKKFIYGCDALLTPNEFVEKMSK